MAAASSTPVFCFSCGKDLTQFPKSRKSIVGDAFHDSLTEWKQLVVLCFKEIGYSDIDVDALIRDEKFNGKCCCLCTAALSRLGNGVFQHWKRIQMIQMKINKWMVKTKKVMIKTSQKYNCVSLPHNKEQSKDVVAVVVKSEQCQKTYVLTPERMRKGLALARRSNKVMADECLRSKPTRKHIDNDIVRLIKGDLKRLSKLNSYFIYKAPVQLKCFSWDKVYSELETVAPTFLSFFLAATHTKNPKSNRRAVIGICASIILKYRFGRLNIFQKILLSFCFLVVVLKRQLTLQATLINHEVQDESENQMTMMITIQLMCYMGLKLMCSLQK
uniref:ZAD domain-containing protein n=1 Tax=Amphimedon queenslandica TaxID=400682 RepID=A0A1X7TE76_AMPQE